MYAIAILLLIIGGAISLGGTIAWIGALIGLITAITPLAGFGILCGGAALEVIAIVMFFAFRPKMENVGAMMGNALGSMMKGMESSFDELDFD